MRRANALLITILMIGGIFATVGYLRIVAPPNCPQPPVGGTPTTYGQISSTSINSKSYWIFNVTFNAAGESVDISNFATFLTTYFVNPNLPHLVGDACVAEPNASFQATIRITFKNDGTSQDVSFNYGGNPQAPPVSKYTVNHAPQAGVLWSQGNAYISLLVSSS